tara:strand:+ start:1637 stop:1987 length:351 start_codon:yes stop_codon:yes gene_type:complete
MENKDVNITLKLNTNMLLVTMMILFLISTIFFCAFYNLPIFKKLRKLLKRELVDSKVEPFSMPSMKDIMDAPKEFVKDINDVICNKSGDEKNKDNKKITHQKKPVVEGFFTNRNPN